MNSDTISHGSANAIQRETALAKIRTSAAQREDLVSLVRLAGARVLDVSTAEMIVEITDVPQRVDAFIAQIRPHGLTELMRTGRLAMMRGPMRPLALHSFRDQADGAGGA